MDFILHRITGFSICFIWISGLKKPSIQNQLNILFNSTLLITFATYLSYSRAIWLGLTAALD